MRVDSVQYAGVGCVIMGWLGSYGAIESVSYVNEFAQSCLSDFANRLTIVLEDRGFLALATGC